MSEENQPQQAPDPVRILVREFNDLLVALGATGQSDVAPMGLVSLSRGHRQWLASKNPNCVQFVKPKQYWYVILHAPHGGGVGVVKAYTEIHPVRFVELNAPGAIIMTALEISEEDYLEFKDPKMIQPA